VADVPAGEGAADLLRASMPLLLASPLHGAMAQQHKMKIGT